MTDSNMVHMLPRSIYTCTFSQDPMRKANRLSDADNFVPLVQAQTVKPIQLLLNSVASNAYRAEM